MVGSSVPPRIEHVHVPMTGPALCPSLRCTQCNAQRKEDTRNLVVCIDGTSNQFGQDDTNVVKLFTQIDLKSTNPQQRTYYSSGIGTHPKSSHIFNRMGRVVMDNFDMAVAWNIDKIVKHAYRWLAQEYREGDQIYLFGFSRGAYQVRVLAGMIHEVGFIKMPTEEQVAWAYEYYEAICSRKPRARRITRKFQDKLFSKARVHFVGVWDTVSSVGPIRGDIFPSYVAHACHFRHALALDELRVKFMPEYFHKINSLMHYGRSNPSDNGTDLFGGNWTTSDIKEVWFAGSHPDVGGMKRPRKSPQAGIISLLWMRREAAASGLVLEPTDMVWVSADLDLGIRDSMNWKWRPIEYVPIMHQVSFSGNGEDDLCLHLLQPRRIIPGQKVHASVLYADEYRSKATLGEGFDIPIMELDNQIWDTGLFDDTAAQQLVTHLGSQQNVAPIYLDRLMFMLQFEEGKQRIRSIPGWKDVFMNLIQNRDCALLIRLFTIAAYYETTCDHDTDPNSCALLPIEGEGLEDTFSNVRMCVRTILAVDEHRDGPRVVALLRSLTKHPILREQILTQDVLEGLMRLLDGIVKQPKGHFGQAMNGVNCLLQCEGTRHSVVEQLRNSPPNSTMSRVSRILQVDDPRLLIAALRMVLTLARIPEAIDVCTAVKPRIKKLAGQDEQPVGPIAAEILLALNDEELNLRNAHVRASFACALFCLTSGKHDLADQQGGGANPVRQNLRSLFGLDATELTERQKELIGGLQEGVQKGNVRERTAATMTLLKLCENMIIRGRLCEIKLLDVFIHQMRYKDTALLAAYALATCLKHGDMKQSIRGNQDLPKHMVGMLILDYFDDAVGEIEGFQIFRDLMQHGELRGQVKRYNITEALNTKLRKNKSKEFRTSLICWEIFRSFDLETTWAHDLVDESLKYLKDPGRKAQKAGLTILAVLAQSERGVEAISRRIPDIAILLSIPSKGQAQITEAKSLCMMGAACALRILAQNETLRTHTRQTGQYDRLKALHESGTLVDEIHRALSWRVCASTRAGVIGMLDKMIKAIDGQLSEGPMSIRNFVLPYWGW